MEGRPSGVLSCGVVDIESVNVLRWPRANMFGVIVAPPSGLALDVENAVFIIDRVELGFVAHSGRDTDDEEMERSGDVRVTSCISIVLLRSILPRFPFSIFRFEFVFASVGVICVVSRPFPVSSFLGCSFVSPLSFAATR